MEALNNRTGIISDSDLYLYQQLTEQEKNGIIHKLDINNKISFQEEKKITNEERVVQSIMNIYSLDRKGAEEKIHEMVNSVVVEYV